MSELESSIQVDGATLAFDVRGSGPVVVFVHGLTASRANNIPGDLMDFSPVVDAGFTLVRYDARGHGRSTGTSEPGDYHWARLARDLLALIDHVSPDRPVAAIGNSMGTGTILYAALYAAGEQPARFSALVLTAPPTAWQTRAAQSGAYRAMADAVERHDDAALEAMLATMAEPDIFAGLNDPVPGIAPELFPVVLRGAASTDLPDPVELARITQPTLLLPWASDPGHPVSTAEILAATLPYAELRLAENTADIAAFGQWSADFLAAHVRPQSDGGSAPAP